MDHNLSAEAERQVIQLSPWMQVIHWGCENPVIAEILLNCFYKQLVSVKDFIWIYLKT